jgi:hypothetical protein
MSKKIQNGESQEKRLQKCKDVYAYSLTIIKHHPGLLALADIFVNVSEEKRAAHSIKMNAKLSDRA